MAAPRDLRPACREDAPSTSAVPVVGLMVTKDDDAVIKEWLDFNAPYLSALVLLDSSAGGGTEVAVRRYRRRCPRAQVEYMHERELDPPLTYWSDQALRQPVLARIRRLHGRGRWVMVCHSDEFFYHAPERVASLVQAALQAAATPGAVRPRWGRQFRGDRLLRCNRVAWYTLHVVPHPSEYALYELHRRGRRPTLLQQRYQHYHTHSADWNNGQGPAMEWRLFLDDEGTEYNASSATAKGTLPVHGARRCPLPGAAYIHYKVVSPGLAAYDSKGKHRRHWRRAGVNGVGVGGQLQQYNSSRDFFVSAFRNFRRSARFEGCLALAGRRWGPTPVAAESVRVPRRWPLRHGSGECEAAEMKQAAQLQNATALPKAETPAPPWPRRGVEKRGARGRRHTRDQPLVRHAGVREVPSHVDGLGRRMNK